MLVWVRGVGVETGVVVVVARVVALGVIGGYERMKSEEERL